jgi:hypothetical protein
MGLITEPGSAAIYDPILRRIQKHLAHQVKIPFEIRLWGDRAYRFGEGEPAVDILVHDRKGLTALSRLDELGICEAYMSGSLDVVGDMLRFVGLRGTLSDSHPLHYFWRRIAPWLIGRFTTNRQAIAAHYVMIATITTSPARPGPKSWRQQRMKSFAAGARGFTGASGSISGGRPTPFSIAAWRPTGWSWSDPGKPDSKPAPMHGGGGFTGLSTCCFKKGLDDRIASG